MASFYRFSVLSCVIMSGEVSRKKKYNKGKSKKDDVQLDSDGGLCVVSGIENEIIHLTPRPSVLMIILLF